MCSRIGSGTRGRRVVTCQEDEDQGAMGLAR
jgi:hypothetical protein